MAERQTGEFADLLASLARWVGRVERDRVCCGDLTFQQFETLSRVSRMAAASVKTVAAEVGIDESTASRNVALLVRDGYLAKTRDDVDGRAVRLVLTSRGRAAVSELHCGAQEALAGVFGRIPAEERATVMRALRIVDWALAGQEAFSSDGPSQLITIGKLTRRG